MRERGRCERRRSSWAEKNICMVEGKVSDCEACGKHVNIHQRSE
jgi:hypothetical protein